MRTGPAVKSTVFLTVALAIIGVRPLFGNKPTFAALTNQQVLSMLDEIEKDIHENYYDASLHGLDLSKTFAAARAKIQTAPSQDEGLLQIAGAVAALGDSHTRFVPPIRPYSVDYGFRMQAIGGSACYVTGIRPGSDAEAKGLRPGDRILAINGVTLIRQDIATIEYGYRVFPQSGLHLEVQSPSGPVRPLVVMATVTPGQKAITAMDVRNWERLHQTQSEVEQYFNEGKQSQFFEAGSKTLFWKLPSFMIDAHELTAQAGKARSFSCLILDLRGNRGGSGNALTALLGEFFVHDVTIGEQKSRSKSTPLVVRGRGDHAIGAKLIVLIDSNSASAAEVFARVVQLEKRGIVLGDRSAGHVMESHVFVHAVALDRLNVTRYGSYITTGDLIMTDGQRLEGVGVAPDEQILPTPDDLQAGRDPVMIRAAELAGVDLSPEKSGHIFTSKWDAQPFEME